MLYPTWHFSFGSDIMTSFRHFVRGLVGLFAIASCATWSAGAWNFVTAAPDAHSMHRPVVLLAGDSVTELGANPTKIGWVTLLQYRYTRSADVMVRGLSGYNTRWFLKHAMPIIIDEIESGAYTPSLITVWFGVNDAVLVNGSDAVKYVPIENYTENLINMVGSFQAATPDAKILLITPPHVDDSARATFAAERNDSKRGLIDRSNTMAGNYARACVEVATKLGVPVLDVHTYFNSLPESTRNELLADGLHYNAAGNKVMDEQIQLKIKAEFPDLVSRLESWQLPTPNTWVTEDKRMVPI